MNQSENDTDTYLQKIGKNVICFLIDYKGNDCKCNCS